MKTNTKPRLVVGCIILFGGALFVAMLGVSREPQAGNGKVAEHSLAPKHQTESSRRTAAQKAAEFARLQEEILALLATKDPASINRVYQKLVPALAKLDPEAAAAFASSQENPEWRADLMMVVVQSWASFDPDKAQDWAANLPNPADNPRERDTMVSYVSFEVAKTNPERAVRVLRETNINADRREIMVESLSQQWSRADDLQPLAEWLATFPEGEERDSLFARVANAQAQTDPARAAALVSREIPAGQIHEEAVLNVLRKWAWTDAEAASKWVELFPKDDPIYMLAIKTLGETVARRNGLTKPPAQVTR
ncbi:hypothetical protein [Luteolibacter luteus]|uniref:Uncharacterized protein n=1 Tax=Luteolibacter luteus TaxID=2728835 RepID=A0A858RCZ8_9BACT|nr:hypothetical protein [Luteolibacter luteus]QJE94612.1 hypothetical protein HHL09_02045 [Luteolibacter luteus]